MHINEVESSGGVPGDWIELINTGAAPADISGWLIRDNDDTHTYFLPAGTIIPAGGYLVVEEASLGFGLGSADSVRLFDPAGVALRNRQLDGTRDDNLRPLPEWHGRVHHDHQPDQGRRQRLRAAR